MSAVKRLLALAALAAITIAGCSKADTSAARGIRINPWTHPHVLTFTDASDIDSLNPMFSTELTVSYLSSMTAAFLTKWDRHNKPYPELSTEVPTMANGGVSKDGLTIAFHLRKGLKWSDGAPLDADDVVWTYHAIMNPANNAGSRMLLLAPKGEARGFVLKTFENLGIDLSRSCVHLQRCGGNSQQDLLLQDHYLVSPLGR